MSKKTYGIKSCSTAVVFFVLFHTTVAFAAHPLITDDTATQGKGKIQLEANAEYDQDKDNGVTTNTIQIASTLSYGISDPLDIVLTVPYLHVKTKDHGTVSDNSISDIVLEAKWRFYENKGLSFALKPGLTLPTGNNEKGLGTGRATYHLFLIASRELNPWAFHLNLGYIRNDNKCDERKDIWHASFAATVEVVKDLKVVGNIGIEKDTEKSSSSDPAFILGGLIYSVSENLDIDFGVKSEFNRPGTDYSILAGITYRF
jgi:hypothetical protein